MENQHPISSEENQKMSSTEATNSATDIKALNEKIQKESSFVDLLTMEMDKVIVGQKYMVERLLVGLLSDGHILLEGVPGLAKTLAINTLAKAIEADFSRIQFTPDLLPADLVGTMIYSQKKEEFSIKKDRFSPTSFWLMKSIERLQKCSRLYLRPCRKSKSPLEKPLLNCQSHFWF